MLNRILFLGQLLLTASTLFAQVDRITGEIDRTRTNIIRGGVRAQGRPLVDQGPAAPATELAYVTMLLRPSPSQQAAIDQLLDEQQSPWSPNFRKWLTPEQYADRFGLSRGDIAKITSWMKSEGLTVNDVGRGRQWITFTASAAKISSALRTEIRRYRVDGGEGVANASDPSVPAALASVVAGFHGLENLPETRRRRATPVSAPQNNTSTGVHYLAPDDFATIYNVKALYQAGFEGTGQKIAIIGRSNINLEDMRGFRTRFNLPANDPQVVLFGPDPGFTPSEDEAILDLQWSGAVAPKATIIYVNSTSVVTSAQYAVDNNLAPVISFSFGGCEQVSNAAFRTVAQQAAAQGITWLASSGDSGGTSCDAHYSTSVRQATKGLAVLTPASFPEVTAVGGTMFDEGSGNYWASSNNANGGSALSYIPEKVWNENGAEGLLASGGGASIFFAKPAWQSGFGVPNDNARDLPDLSFSAAFHDGYLVNIDGQYYGFSGTSASTPAFAGIVALLNQYLTDKGSLRQPGLGNINPALYRLAQTTTNVFHDITAGHNMSPCAQSSPGCVNGQAGYQAGPGYDLATGLGSVDAYNFVTQWTTSVGNTTTSLTTDSSSVALNRDLKLTASVSASGSGVLSGTVSFVCVNNHLALGSATLDVTGASGTASLTVPANLLPAGNDNIQAVYSGNANFDGSSATAAVTVTVPSGGAVVSATITPSPVYQRPDGSWVIAITLREVAGVAATLTGFTINGTAQTVSTFFTTTAILPRGTITGNVRATATTPVLRTFGFTGTDANGQAWSQTVSTQFLGPGSLVPLILLATLANTVQQNPAAEASCQWSQPLFLQEQSGFAVQLTRLTVGSTDLSSQIQRIFGTTRLAPFGTLEGTMCLSGINPPSTQSVAVTGTADNGGTAFITLTTTFTAAAATPSHFSPSESKISMQVAGASETATAVVTVDTEDGNFTVFPPGRTTSWLRVVVTGGSGSSRFALTASGAGLSNGVYNATLVVRTVNSTPQYLKVPISFTVGAAGTTTINGASSAFSGRPVLAPGMLASIYGSGLAPATEHAGSLPLPYSMQGVSATVNGVSAPILDVLAGQLNIQIPYETGTGVAVIGVNNNGKVASFQANVAAASPDVWPHFLSLAGAVVSEARQGAVLTTFMTGEGDLSLLLPNGATPSSNTPPAAPRLPITVTVGGVPARLLFGAIPQGLAGVAQINFVVPGDAPLGIQPVVISVGGVPAAQVGLTVTQ